MKSHIPTYQLQIGELMIGIDPSIINTVLGSCVSVCLYSESQKLGGMIHYAHPSMALDFGQAADFRYGDIAIPTLIEEMEKATGEMASTFTAKIVGGADSSDSDPHPVGLENIRIAKDLLEKYHIPVIAEDTGGFQSRRIRFHTHNGRLQVAPISNSIKNTFTRNKHRRNVLIVDSSKTMSERLKKNQEDLDLYKILAIGASTGGTEALKNLLCALPEKIPATLIVQHIPPGFSKAFADRLNELCAFEVKEARDGDEILPSRVLIAPGGKQMRIHRAANGKLSIRITDDPEVNGHKPSVDYLFLSVAQEVGKNTIGVILTGMGSDGARGLLALRKAGSQTLGQDEESCVVYGMPRAAFELGAVDKLVPLDKMPFEILNCLAAKKSA